MNLSLYNLSSCPIPLQEYPVVTLAHGGGGRMMNQLIEKMFYGVFKNPILDQQHDSAILDIPSGKAAFTTDTFTVSPLFFPGGDIGSLAINGTVNDLAMAGAQPRYISLGFVLEEGFPMEDLWKITLSLQKAAELAGVWIVTGDTKVVEKGKGDGIYINSAGVGIIDHQLHINSRSIQIGDAILINGDLGRHGMAIMAKRDSLEFETELKSDCAPLNFMIQDLIQQGIEIHMLRDLTRGGLASALNEISHSSNLSIEIDETLVPVREMVKGACEILGFDPLYVANEGKFVAIVAQKDKEKALHILRGHENGRESVELGRVIAKENIPVKSKNILGSYRMLDMLSGEQLPRIC